MRELVSWPAWCALALAACGGTAGDPCAAPADVVGCAPYYEAEVTRVSCDQVVRKVAARTCDGHLVVTWDLTTGSKACFYAPDTKQLIGSRGYSDGTPFCDGTAHRVSWGTGSDECARASQDEQVLCVSVREGDGGAADAVVVRAQEGQACSTRPGDDPQLICSTAQDLICISTFGRSVTDPEEQKKYDGGVRPVFVCRFSCGTTAECPQQGDVCCPGQIFGKTFGKTAACVPRGSCETVASVDGGR
jgi:hypothetical protein